MKEREEKEGKDGKNKKQIMERVNKKFRYFPLLNPNTHYLLKHTCLLASGINHWNH